LQPLGKNKLANLFKALIKNESYKIYFLNRYADLLNTTFKSENMVDETDLTVASIDAEMFLHFQKWTWPGYDVWKEVRLSTLYDFSWERPRYARQYLMDFFELPNEVQLKLNVHPVGAGTIEINTITPDQLPWEGYYFNGVPVTLTVVPNPGYTFNYWESTRTLLSPDASNQITYNFEQDDEITAFFETEETPLVLQISPNPVGDNVQVNLVLDEVSAVVVNLYDVNGRRLKQYDFGRVGGGQQRLDLDTFEWPHGVYLLELKTDKETVVEKIIK